MDILNFISWIKGKRLVTTVDPAKTLLPVALKDDRRDDDYLTGAISVEDLAAQVGGLQTVAVDGTTIQGDGTPANPLVSNSGVQSVTGLDTDNTYPLNPIIRIKVDGTTITGDGTPASPLIATVPTPSYKVYSALLTQTGTADPVATVVTNTLGTVTIARVSPGRYSVTTSGLFTLNKTIISINTITSSAGPYGGYTGISDAGSTNVFYIDTTKVIASGGLIPGVGADDVWLRTPLEIRVYN